MRSQNTHLKGRIFRDIEIKQNISNYLHKFDVTKYSSPVANDEGLDEGPDETFL